MYVEFLSERDKNTWDQERRNEGEDIFSGSVRFYDLPKTAAYVAQRVKRQATDKLYFGTFYDPMAGTLDISKRAAELLAAGAAKSSNKVVDAKVESLGNGKTTMTLSQPASAPWVDPKAESLRLLRLQVQDFLKWLQAQGAI